MENPIEFLINEEKSIFDAMQQLNKGAKKVLFVTKKDRFVGAITDGDIRRWLLKKGNTNEKVKKIANYNPKYLFEKDKGKAIEFMKKHSIEAIPILDKDYNIISIKLWNNLEIKTKKRLNAPVVIMAGGLGKRLYPYTKILPKPLIPIGEIPIIEHIINRFNQFDTNHYYLIVNHKRNMIKAYFNEIEKTYKIDFVDEVKPLGTGGGLGLLKERIDRTFILTNSDILIEEDYEKIYNYHKSEKSLITMVCSLKNINLPYGVVEINDNAEIENMKEKPELSFFTNTGMYIVEPRIILELDGDKYIDFPDIINYYKDKGEKISIYPINDDNWMDMGQIEELEEMRRRLENR